MFKVNLSSSIKKGFTILELLITIAIIAILSTIAISSLVRAKHKAYEGRAKAELRSIEESLALYYIDHASYPADSNRNVPPGLEQYLAPGLWPDAAWPGSVFDWENWGPSDLDYPPYEQTYQISIRFCPIGEPENCQFPQEDWAEDFDINSAVYWCIEGACRSHSSKPVEHPGYCINCNN